MITTTFNEPTFLTMEDLMDHLLHDLARKMDDSPGIRHFARTFHRCEGWLRVEVVGLLSRAGVRSINVEDREPALLGGERYVDITFPNAVLEIACTVDDAPPRSWSRELQERLMAFDKYLYQYLLACVLGARPTEIEREGFQVVHRIDGEGYTLILYRRNR